MFNEKITTGAHLEAIEVRGPVRIPLKLPLSHDLNPVVLVPVDDVVVGDGRQRPRPDPVAVERVRQSIVDVGWGC